MGSHCCKVGKIIGRYELEQRTVGRNLNEYLLARWLGRETFPETGVRPLTDTVNRKLLEAVYAQTDRRTTDTQLDSYYHALTGDDEIRRGEVLDDVDEVVASAPDPPVDSAEGLADDFISSSTLYRHLTNCLDGEKARRSNEDSDWEKLKIAYVTDALNDNVESALRSLENKGRIPDATAAEIDIPVILGCPMCSTQVRFERAINRGYICKEHMGSDDDPDNATKTGDPADNYEGNDEQRQTPPT